MNVELRDLSARDGCWSILMSSNSFLSPCGYCSNRSWGNWFKCYTLIQAFVNIKYIANISKCTSLVLTFYMYMSRYSRWLWVAKQKMSAPPWLHLCVLVLPLVSKVHDESLNFRFLQHLIAVFFWYKIVNLLSLISTQAYSFQVNMPSQSGISLRSGMA